MLDKRFTILFAVVTATVAAAVYLLDQAVTRGGTVLSILAATAAVIGALGLIVLSRIVVLVERRRRPR